MADLTTRPAIINIASADLMHIVDVSDFTSTPLGTSKKVTTAQLAASLLTIDIIIPLGANQASATPVTAYENILDTVAAGTGVILTSSLKNYSVIITNADATEDVNVYPEVGANFIGMAVNDPFVVAALTSWRFRVATAGIYRT